MHLSYYDVTRTAFNYNTTTLWFLAKEELHNLGLKELDDAFFFSVPTSFFVMNDEIPRKLRDLVTEAEGCLKSNFLTGASACIRKVVYELAVLEGATGENYEDRIKSLKAKRPDVEGSYFDTLLSVQQVTSDKVHENSYDGWDAKHIKLLLTTLHETLNELYVLPSLKKENRRKVLELKETILGSKSLPDSKQPKG
jgi:hypothetical protein